MNERSRGYNVVIYKISVLYLQNVGYLMLEACDRSRFHRDQMLHECNLERDLVVFVDREVASVLF